MSGLKRHRLLDCVTAFLIVVMGAEAVVLATVASDQNTDTAKVLFIIAVTLPPCLSIAVGFKTLGMLRLKSTGLAYRSILVSCIIAHLLIVCVGIYGASTVHPIIGVFSFIGVFNLGVTSVLSVLGRLQ
jgi:hypothetical protein